MIRSHMAALLGLLAIALGTGTATAQTAPPMPSATAPATPETQPATPGATSPAMPAATPAAMPATAPSAAPKHSWTRDRGPEAFLAGDYLFGTFSRNEFNPLGLNDKQSFAGRAAVSYPFGKLNVMAEGTYDHFRYVHQAGTVATIGGGQAFAPTFTANTTDWDGRVGLGLPFPRVFVVASYGQRRNNFGYPNLQGFGVGIEKLPDFDQKNASFYGSYLYYPQYGGGKFLQYGMYKYSFGIEIHANKNQHIPLFVEFGVIGDYAYAKRNAPTYLSDSGVTAGLGLHL